MSMSRIRNRATAAKIAIGAFLFWLTAVGALGIGWIMNIVSIIHVISEPITPMIILRLVGIIVFPLGGILGYL